MSAVAHFFVAVSGSFIHERMAQLFIDIYSYLETTITYNTFTLMVELRNTLFYYVDNILAIQCKLRLI